MSEEEKMIEAKQWISRKRIDETIAAINKNNMVGVYASDKESARNEVLKRIPDGRNGLSRRIFHAPELGVIESPGERRLPLSEVKGRRGGKGL